MVLLLNSQVGFKNLNNVNILASSTGTASIDFTGMTPGVYELCLSNIYSGEYWVGYVMWNNPTTPLYLFGTTPFTGGITVTVTSPNANISNLVAQYTYPCGVRYLGKSDYLQT
jgi:hypothetical protein